MITLLENALERADGTYLSSQDLAILDRVISSWKQRRETYDLVQAKESEIIAQVLTQFQYQRQQMNAPISEGMVNKCQRDLTLVLRYCATAMLLDDPELLKDRLLYWLQNIMRALRNQKYNDEIYQLLQQVVQQKLPSLSAKLMLPYLTLTHEWLSK